jgi:uncharacterized membrane protein
MATQSTPRLLAPVGVVGNERINAFSDGLFAIAITLLILELKVPDKLPPGGLLQMVPELLPKYLGHVLSFVVLGVYWVGQHNMFLHIKRHNRVFLWLNLLFLMFVASMPFFAGLIIHHLDDQLSMLLYAGNLVLAGISLDLIWWYSSTNRRLVDPAMPEDLVRFVHRRVLMAPAIYLVAMAVSLASPIAAACIFILVPLLHIFPTPLDRYHHRALATETADESAERKG